MKNWTLYFFFFLFGLLWQSFSMQAQSVYYIDTRDDFVKTVPLLLAGDTLIMSNGVYLNWGELRFDGVSGTQNQPVVIKSESVYGVTFSGDIWMRFVNSNNIWFIGFRFNNILNERGRALNFQSSNYITVNQCSFINSGNFNIPMNMLRFDVDLDNDPNMNAFNVIQNCFFSKITGVALTVTASDSKHNIGKNKIINNIFRDADKILQNGGEAIVLYSKGKQENNPLYCYVEGNVFDNWNGDPEVISVKSGRNLIRHNVFTNSDCSFLSLRREKVNIIEANIFKNLNMGIWVYSEDHLIVNNIFDGITSEAIRLSSAGTSGTIIFEASRNNIIAHNTFLNTGGNIVRFLWDKNYYFGSLPFGNKFYNNIMTSDEGIILNPSSDELETNFFDYNLYWTDGTATIPKVDKHNINENPLIGDGTNEHYSISEHSPVAGSGVFLEQVAIDFYGNPRESTDIGHVNIPADTTNYQSPFLFFPPDIRGYFFKPDEADFDYSPKFVRDGDIVMLDARKSKGGYQKVSWNISNENSGFLTESVYSFVYDSTKDYQVTLFIWDAQNNFLDSITRDLTFSTAVSRIEYPDLLMSDEVTSLEKPLNNSIFLYPNPTTGLIHVMGLESIPEQYSVFNINGTLVKSGIIDNSSSVNLSSLPTGLYLFEAGNTNSKIVKVLD